MNHLKAKEAVEEQLDGWFFNLKVFMINIV